MVQGNGPGGMVLSLSFPAVRAFLVNYDLTNCSGYANMVYVAVLGLSSTACTLTQVGVHEGLLKV